MQVCLLKKIHWTLKYFSVLWLKLTVNFITNFENPAIKMKSVITSPAINVCVLKFWLNSEPYWHWPWHRPWPWPWPWRLWPWLQVCPTVKLCDLSLILLVTNGQTDRVAMAKERCSISYSYKLQRSKNVKQQQNKMRRHTAVKNSSALRSQRQEQQAWTLHH